jgi:hypothetical protein
MTIQVNDLQRYDSTIYVLSFPQLDWRGDDVRCRGRFAAIRDHKIIALRD